MADRIDDNVGKKIVEALKMQGQEDIPNDESLEIYENSGLNDSVENDSIIATKENSPIYEEPETSIPMDYIDNQTTYTPNPSFVENTFQQCLEKNIGNVNMFGNIETPANIEILKQLIAKLPAGVSKQTGALIIQQTMEALGISMKSVIAEARQVQTELSNNVRECQANIVDSRKQIATLENKVQQYQKQYAMLNDIIGLFIHTSK